MRLKKEIAFILPDIYTMSRELPYRARFTFMRKLNGVGGADVR